MVEKIVLDTSIIINGEFSKRFETGFTEECEIIIPVVVVDELHSQASQGKENGIIGLEELKKINELGEQKNFKIIFEGTRPGWDEIRLASHGRIDSIIIDVAKQNGAILYTSDRIQAQVAEVEGIRVNFILPSIQIQKLEFQKFLDDQTMSLHLKEGLPPMAKRGKPGLVSFEKVDEKILTKEYLKLIADEIIGISKSDRRTSIEISKPGASVIQFQDYRIAISYPPLSESYEITIVHPILQRSLGDYEISEKLMERFSKGAEGIVIAGSPGSGKSTLASGLANFYSEQGKVVKTFESPRDLQVGPGITQYSKLDGSFENTAEILLLVRPDYTIFDEVRRMEDFRVFSDLRLSGVGMVGVVHGNSPMDAVQRFIGKVELGIIPSIIDTVVFLEKGDISKVYELEYKVKVPSGMTEQDLARPVIEIKDFETNELKYEIYTFGEENVSIPVKNSDSSSGIDKLAEEKIREEFMRFDNSPIVKILSSDRAVVKVDSLSVPLIIGRGGQKIKDLEQKLKIHLTVKEKEKNDAIVDSNKILSNKYPVNYDFSESNFWLKFEVGKEHHGKYANIMVKGDLVFSTKIDKRGRIKVSKRSDVAKKIMNDTYSKNDIQVFV